MTIAYQNLDRCTTNEDTLRGIASMLLDNADEIEEIFPFQANGMRNMAKALVPTN